MLKNEIFQINSNCTLSSDNHVAYLKSFLLQNVVFTVEFLGSQQVALKEKERGNDDLQRRINALIDEKRDCKFVAKQSRGGELDRL